MNHTSLTIGEQSAHKPLAKFGSASVQRMIECAWCGSRLKGCGCDEYLSSSTTKEAGVSSPCGVAPRLDQ